MSVKVRGEKQLIAALESKFGERSMQRFAQTAQRRAAEYVLNEIKRELASIRGKYRTGATVKETTLKGPERLNGEWVYTIGWVGPDNRYRIIHLNEWGTVRIPNPPLKGAIARAVKNSEKKYFMMIRNSLAKEIQR